MADIFHIALGKALDSFGPAGGASGQPAGPSQDQVFDALLGQESGGKQFDKSGAPLTSKAGAIGIAQVMPATAPEAAKLAGLEYDEMRYRTDPEYNKALGRAYYNRQLQDFDGDTARALAAYNAGPQRLRTALATAEKNGTPEAWLQYMPRETQQYVPSILRKVGLGAPAAKGEFVTPTGQEYVGAAKEREKATLMDFGKELAASATEGVGSMIQFAGEGAAALANRVTGTNDYEGFNPLKPAAEAVRNTMTEGGKQARADARVEGSVVDLLSGDAGLPGSVDGWLMMAASGFGSLATTLIPIAGPAARVASLTKAARAAEAAGDAAKAAELFKAAEAASRTSRAIGVGTGGAMTGGAAAEDVRQSAAATLAKMSHEQLLAEVPTYAEAFNATGDEQSARQAVVNQAAQYASLGAAAFGAAGGYLNARVLEDFVAKKGMARVLGDSVASRTGRAAIGGGVGSVAEGGQETTEKVGQNVGENIALGRAAGDNALRNTAGDFLGGALVGGPVGAVGGFASSPSLPPELKPVADKAAEPNSPLSRAAMAGNAGALSAAAATASPAVPPAGAVPPTDTRPPAADDLVQRVRNLEEGMRTEGWLDNLRLDGLDSREVLADMALARNVNAPRAAREAALERVETATFFANRDAPPPSPMDSIAGNPDFDFTTPQPEPRAPRDVPALDAVAGALRDPALRGKISGPDRQQLLYLYNLANNSQGENTVRINAAQQALEIVGRYQAPTGTPSAQGASALEQSAPATPDSAAPTSQPNVASQPNELDFLTTAPAPAKATGPLGGDTEQPAFLRKRANVVRQLVDNGFETVARDGSTFFLTNAKTGQKFQLDGPADAQLARKAIKDRVDALANTAAASPQNNLLEPTEAQIAAGNYKKSDVIDLNGMRIKIENPQGSTRRGTSPDGKQWESKMAHHYGEFQGTVGADGDKLDVFIGSRPSDSSVFVIDQLNKDGSFDEHKVMMGFPTEEAARQGYLANYEPGWTGLGAITKMSVDEFKTWAKSRAAKKPAAGSGVAQSATTVAPEATAAAAPGAAVEAAITQPNLTSAEQADADGQPKFFYVSDGGEQRKLRLVRASELPKQTSAPRGRGPSPLSQEDGELIQTIADMLGKQVVFYKAEGKRLVDGFIIPGQPNTLFVASETTINPLAVFGHEFFHTLRATNPEAWNAIAAVVRERVIDPKSFRKDYYGSVVVRDADGKTVKAFRGKSAAKNAKEFVAKSGRTDLKIGEQSGEALSEQVGGELEELVSDLGGNLLKDPTFWGEVLLKIQEENGANAKGIIAKLVALFKRMVARILDAAQLPGYRADSFVKDLEQVRAAFRDAMADYMKSSGVSQRAMAAEQLRAEQQLKKSEDRVKRAHTQLKKNGLNDWSATTDLRDEGIPVLLQTRTSGGALITSATEFVDGRETTKNITGTPKMKVDQMSIGNHHKKVVQRFREMAKIAGIRKSEDRTQTETPEFKRWFGKSDAVDESGKPLVVYTATNQDFSTFEPGRGITRDGIAAWVSVGPEFANQYASAKYRHWKFAHTPWETDYMVPQGLNIIPAYINPQRPFDVTGMIKNLAAPIDDAEAQAVADRLGVSKSLLLDGIPEKDVFSNGYERKHSPIGSDLVRTPVAVQAIRDAGFDSVKATEGGSTVYALFEPTQIKSAIGNSGAFDPTNPDIRKSEDRPEGLTVTGYHFSQQPRKTLSTSFFGTGLRGSARDEIMSSADGRIRERLSFYFDKGTGVRPESGVGGIAHRATLTNIYDADADPLRLKGGNARAFESKVLDNGYSGYLTRLEGTQPGQVILLGKQTITPEVLGPRSRIEGDETATAPAPKAREMDLGDRIAANKSLPAGSLAPARWSQILMATMPEEAAQLLDIGAFNGDAAMYKDELVRRVRQIMGSERKSAGPQAAGIVFRAADTGRILLAKRGPGVANPGTWSIPGGAVDEGESLIDAAIREAKEEIGYSGDIALEPVTSVKFGNATYNTFIATVPSEFGPRLNWESSSAQWFSPDSLPDGLHPGFADAKAAVVAAAKSPVGMDKQGLAGIARGVGPEIRKSADRAKREYAEVEAKFKGTEQWLKAPNGTPSNLNERQWVQARTPSFKNWFGDWEKFAGKEGGVWSDQLDEVSKAVDENGEPLVVYHGSGEGGFMAFEEPGGEKRGDLGIFATDDVGMAASYVRRNRARRVVEPADDDPQAGDQPGIYALFVNIRNPSESHFEGANWDGSRYGQYQVLDADGDLIYTDDGRAYLEQDEAERLASENDGATAEPAGDNYETTDDVVRGARRSRNDGAIIRSVMDDGGGPGYGGEPADVFVAFRPNQVKSADFNGGVFSASEDDIRKTEDRVGDVSLHNLVAERGERVVAARVVLSDAERKAIEKSAVNTGLDAEEIEATVRDAKAAHPPSNGWAPVVFVRAELETDDSGKQKVAYVYENVPYSFNTDPDGRALKPGTPEYDAAVRRVAGGLVADVREVYERAKAGDKAASNIIAQAAWYKAMRERLRREFGGLGDLYADLLGATSPNTPVRGNWDNAIDSLRRALRGDFDELMPKWIAWADNVDQVEARFKDFFNAMLERGMSKKAIKELGEYQWLAERAKEARNFPDDMLPAKESGKKYGFNGQNVVRAMIDLWRVVKNADPDIGRGGTAPKALNFSGNLIGFRGRATIDVWAARNLQRNAGRPRIASMAETGVSGSMLTSGDATLQFGFGQDVFTQAVQWVRADVDMAQSDVLSKINDDDLQALVWFVEKEIWTRNSWTSAAGEGGSFEFEADLAGVKDQARVRELRRIADSSISATSAQKEVAQARIYEIADELEPYQDAAAAMAAVVKMTAAVRKAKKSNDGSAKSDRALAKLQTSLEGLKARVAVTLERLPKSRRSAAQVTARIGALKKGAARLAKTFDRPLPEQLRATRESSLRELARMSRTLDRFFLGLSVQSSSEIQGQASVPTDAKQAQVAQEIHGAAYKGDNGRSLVAAKVYSTEGRYGTPERAFDGEFIARDGFNPLPLAAKTFEVAQRERQDSAFVARVLRPDENVDLTLHRPGVEIYFRDSADPDKVEQMMRRVARTAVPRAQPEGEGRSDRYFRIGGYTVVVDGRRTPQALSGAMPKAVGMRIMYLPEFNARYGDSSWNGLTDQRIVGKMEESRLDLERLARRVVDRLPGASFAGVFHYEVDARFNHEYKEAVDAYSDRDAARGPQAPGGGVWSGRSVRDAVAAATAGDGAQRAEPAAEIPGGEPAGIRRSADRNRGGRDPGRGDPQGEGSPDGGGRLAPLPGYPHGNIKGAAGPDPRLVEVAERYARDKGIQLRRQAEYVKVDPERAARIAAAYEAMPHAPQDPKVREAYADLIRQTREQYEALADAGYKFWFMDPGADPYAGNPWNAMRDLRANQRMAVFPTEAGFGTSDFDPEDNPLLADTGLKWAYGSLDGEKRRVLANDLFRAVHDAFGHGLEGAGFRADGEENAWRAHARLFTGPAVAAITSETRGQNSWLNFNQRLFREVVGDERARDLHPDSWQTIKTGEHNRTAGLEDTIFADQKTGLTPEWAWQEGLAGDAPESGAPSGRTIPVEPTKPAQDRSEVEPQEARGRKVTYEVEVEDTGEKARLTVDAGEALADYNQRIATIGKLLECLKK